MRSIFVSALIVTAALSGCESTAIEDNMGKSVAQMKREQVSDPATLTGSQDQVVEGIDPEYATHTLDTMRKDMPPRSEVKRDILINVGSQNGGGGNQ